MMSRHDSHPSTANGSTLSNRIQSKATGESRIACNSADTGAESPQMITIIAAEEETTADWRPVAKRLAADPPARQTKLKSPSACADLACVADEILEDCGEAGAESNARPSTLLGPLVRIIVALLLWQPVLWGITYEQRGRRAAQR
jgi:hypothetical protein